MVGAEIAYILHRTAEIRDRDEWDTTVHIPQDEVVGWCGADIPGAIPGQALIDGALVPVAVPDQEEGRRHVPDHVPEEALGRDFQHAEIPLAEDVCVKDPPVGVLVLDPRKRGKIVLADEGRRTPVHGFHVKVAVPEEVPVGPASRIVARVEFVRHLGISRYKAVPGKLPVQERDGTRGEVGGEGKDLTAGVHTPVGPAGCEESCVVVVGEEFQAHAGSDEFSFNGPLLRLHLRPEVPVSQVADPERQPHRCSVLRLILFHVFVSDCRV